MNPTPSFKPSKYSLHEPSCESSCKSSKTKPSPQKSASPSLAQRQVLKTKAFQISPKSPSPILTKPLTPSSIESSHSHSKLLKGKSKCKTFSRESKNFEINPGKRLYLEGLEKERMKESKIFKILAERKALEEGVLTFKPMINQNSSRLKKKQDLVEKKRLLSEKLLGLKLEQENEEMKKCTFHPEVNKSSALMDKVKTSDRAAFLFYSSELKRRKNEISFKSQTQMKIQEAVERVFHQKQPKTPKFRNHCKSSNREEVKKSEFHSKHNENLHFSYKNFQRLNKSWKLIPYEEVDISTENFRIIS